jgi:sugar phosphate isomerase/epimerase
MNRRQFVRAASAAGLGVAVSGHGLLDDAAAEPGRMAYVFFSKTLRGQSVDELIESLRRMGADGVDLAVRPGYVVDPDNAARELAPAAAKVRAAGLSIPMVTAPTDLNDPSIAYADPLFRACGEAGIGLLKLGYWPYPGKGYWQAVEAMKRDVAGFAKLGTRFGVKPCLHTHSGGNLALNASALMHVLGDFGPREVGAYIDPAHLAVCGEPIAMALDMAADWLAIVSAKDAVKGRSDDGAVPMRVVPVGEGFVNWASTMTWLVRRGFAGPLSFHSEWKSPNVEHLLTQTTKDIAYLRAVEKEVRAKA